MDKRGGGMAPATLVDAVTVTRAHTHVLMSSVRAHVLRTCKLSPRQALEASLQVVLLEDRTCKVSRVDCFSQPRDHRIDRFVGIR